MAGGAVSNDVAKVALQKDFDLTKIPQLGQGTTIPIDLFGINGGQQYNALDEAILMAGGVSSGDLGLGFALAGMQAGQAAQQAAINPFGTYNVKDNNSANQTQQKQKAGNPDYQAYKEMYMEYIKAYREYLATLRGEPVSPSDIDNEKPDDIQSQLQNVLVKLLSQALKDGSIDKKEQALLAALLKVLESTKNKETNEIDPQINQADNNADITDIDSQDQTGGTNVNVTTTVNVGKNSVSEKNNYSDSIAENDIEQEALELTA